MHGPVQKLLVKHDAVDVLQCGSTQKRLFGPEHRDESAVLIIVLHTSSVLVTVRASKKNARINSDRDIIMAIFPNSGVFREVPSYFGPELGVEIKNPGS